MANIDEQALVALKTLLDTGAIVRLEKRPLPFGYEVTVWPKPDASRDDEEHHHYNDETFVGAIMKASKK